MIANQSLVDIGSKVLVGVKDEVERFKPDLMMVQGDTTSAMAAALAGFYLRVPVVHIEAGLRTSSVAAPFPEELNRRLISQMATHHFAPTYQARIHLEKEGVPSTAITVTGNTVVDSLLQNIERARSRSFSSALTKETPLLRDFGEHDNKILLVTLHRRENFGAGIGSICNALRAIAQRHTDVQIVFPVHRNPNVSQPVRQALEGIPNISLLEPLDYLGFLKLLDLSYLVLTDSGGVQEEAPSLGKPVLIMRDETERSEGIDAGTARLVGASADSIVTGVEALLQDKGQYQKMANCHNPYGDGSATNRILAALPGLF
jgi:UDP-N-acetylglucosamine 2-epimerase (non-hydrolysing)